MAETEGRRLLPDLVVTDFAGTTLADDGAVLGAYRHALQQHQIPFPEADLAGQRGATHLPPSVACLPRLFALQARVAA